MNFNKQILERYNFDIGRLVFLLLGVIDCFTLVSTLISKPTISGYLNPIILYLALGPVFIFLFIGLILKLVNLQKILAVVGAILSAAFLIYAASMNWVETSLLDRIMGFMWFGTFVYYSDLYPYKLK